MLKNFDNNKRYIGKTTRDLQIRYKEHLNVAFNEKKKLYNSPLSIGIRESGVPAFKIGILAENIPDEKLDIVESHYINMYNTTDPEIGYNVSEGNNITNEKNSIDYDNIPEVENTSKFNLNNIDDDEIDDLLNIIEGEQDR